MPMNHAFETHVEGGPESGGIPNPWSLLLAFKLLPSDFSRTLIAVSFNRTVSPLRPIPRTPPMTNLHLPSRPGYSPENSVSANFFVRFEHFRVDYIVTPLVDASVSVPNRALAYTNDLRYPPDRCTGACQIRRHV